MKLSRTRQAEIRKSSPERTQYEFQQRRLRLLDELYQLKLDVEWYNENRCPENPIAFSLDLSAEVAALEVQIAAMAAKMEHAEEAES